MNLVILSRGQMTRTTTEQAPASQASAQAGEQLAPCVWFSVQQAHIHGGSSEELGLEPGTLRPRRLELTSRQTAAPALFMNHT
ncbi:hypothetical protein AVEN_92488-1 [Araneus ventricosus]|uniref:Uncharacterized protein n=1 Tax=Araneus ventricosus TaxID=182803 RepID=A0A4Y2AHD4_ARAVE|nr:hypothetical protein AVEN_92488-1 [Araneus ventricosus]